MDGTRTEPRQVPQESVFEVPSSETVGSVMAAPAVAAAPSMTIPLENYHRVRPPLPHRHSDNRMSVATTTMSLVDRIVSDSRFHDDALCDLLKAARDEGMGEAARKAVRKAARERVMVLTGTDEQSSKVKNAPKAPSGRAEPRAVEAVHAVSS